MRRTALALGIYSLILFLAGICSAWPDPCSRRFSAEKEGASLSSILSQGLYQEVSKSDYFSFVLQDIYSQIKNINAEQTRNFAVVRIRGTDTYAQFNFRSDEVYLFVPSLALTEGEVFLFTKSRPSYTDQKKFASIVFAFFAAIQLWGETHHAQNLKIRIELDEFVNLKLMSFFQKRFGFRSIGPSRLELVLDF